MTKKLVLGLILAPFYPNLFPPKKNFVDSTSIRCQTLLQSYQCMQFQGTNEPNLRNGKKSTFGPNFGPSDPNSSHQFFFSKSDFFSNYLILRKCIDGRTDGWMDGLEDRWIRLDLKNYCCHLALGLRVGQVGWDFF